VPLTDASSSQVMVPPAARSQVAQPTTIPGKSYQLISIPYLASNIYLIH